VKLLEGTIGPKAPTEGDATVGGDGGVVEEL